MARAGGRQGEQGDQRQGEQRAAKQAVLDLFATSTGIPITLYEFPNGALADPDLIESEESRARYARHCCRIQEYDGGAACRDDQIARAREVFLSGKPLLKCCHAGMYNEAVPILDEENKPRAVVTYGEVQLIGDTYQQESLDHHNQAVGKLHLAGKLRLPVLQASTLRQFQLQAKRLTREQFEGFGVVLRKTIHLLYALIDQDEQMRRRTDHLSHEIQTPIQDVLGKVDNLLTLWPALDMDEAQRIKAGLPATTLADLHSRLTEVWDAAMRLRTIAQTLTLGNYLATYRFEVLSLLPMLQEARSNYAAEAASRQIGIDIRLRPAKGEGAPMLECSREHLQLALNNLVHNAVKYSFRGSESRHRYVRIDGRFVGDAFLLTVENYGIGILLEEIESGKIFEDGYQGQLRQGEYRTGSGKGLYFVKRIIAHHHGHLEVKSELRTDQEPDPAGKQPYLTRVIVRLPRQQPPSPREETVNGPNAPSTQDDRVD
jgi:signal transduction histidine kinase